MEFEIVSNYRFSALFSSCFEILIWYMLYILNHDKLYTSIFSQYNEFVTGIGLCCAMQYSHNDCLFYYMIGSQTTQLLGMYVIISCYVFKVIHTNHMMSMSQRSEEIYWLLKSNYNQFTQNQTVQLH